MNAKEKILLRRKMRYSGTIIPPHLLDLHHPLIPFSETGGYFFASRLSV